MKKQPNTIRDIEVTETIKYLRILISNIRNCFQKTTTKIIAKARRLSNMVYPIIAESSTKILIGYVFWKSVNRL